MRGHTAWAAAQVPLHGRRSAIERTRAARDDSRGPAAHGHGSGPEALLDQVYSELRVLAASYLRRERRGHTLQPTALVHEAYLRLAGQTRARWKNKAHFCAMAAVVMRRILVSHEAARRCRKRTGDATGLAASLAERTLGVCAERGIDLLALDDALRRLAELDPQQARIVELRFFGGLNVAETAEATGLSRRTVTREWTFARAWLRSILCAGESA